MIFVVHWLVLAVAFAVTAALLPGIEITGGVLTWLWIALVFALVNAVLGTFVRLLSLPLIWLTFGLFAFVVNGAMLLVTDGLLDSFAVDNLWTAILGSILISVIAALSLAVVGDRSGDHQVI